MEKFKDLSNETLKRENKENMENPKIKILKNRQKGITLVALVVTIVVLLILAGITITMLLGDNGIIKQAQKAKELTEQEQTNTQQGLQNLVNELNKYYSNDIDGGSSDNPGGVTEEIYTIEDIGTLVGEGKKYAKYTDSTGTAYIPEGYGVVIGENNTVASGLVISDKAGDTMANDGGGNSAKIGNQFVWVPVSETELNNMVEKYDDTNYRGKLYDFADKNGVPTATYNAEYKPGTTSFREPDIIDNTSNGTGTSYDGAASNINPVLEDKYKDTTGTKKIQEQFKDQLQAEFNSMVASVDKYKGFYIGRYETGGFSGTTTVVQKGKTDLGNQTWYTQYNKSKTIKGENTNVTTSIIWGCQWDQVMNWWLKDNTTKGYVTNSSGKGNYKGTNGDKPIATGHDGYDIKNIYDMAGNVYDWTIGAYSTNFRDTRRRCLLLFRFYSSSF